ncbi:alpha/beta hydrolase family protein [uncultured Corynebacterium sp.]|uniref:alpha/beta hydrolase n=1 Tax=uncultured Corynebacterium sp. TaxID=159447 RepID=UPI0025FE7B7B|nr:alpha/beta hydrolase family protein [uncultured Corynebacterium sp.]
MKNTRTRRLMSASAAAMVALLPVTLAPAAVANPAEAPAAPAATADGNVTPAPVQLEPMEQVNPHWREQIAGHDNVEEVWAGSVSMDRAVPLVWIRPEGAERFAPRPTLYVLNGADGGEGKASWLYQTDIIDYFSDKDVNVVIVQAGEFSYYTDWVDPNTELGAQTWETFLTKELPESLESKIGATGKRGIIGMSMSATSVLNFAQKNPGLYDGVGSFSGCAQTSDDIGAAAIQLVLDRKGVTAEQMWGPRPSENWTANDPLVNAEKLRGQEMYISNGTGLWGEWDTTAHPAVDNEAQLISQRTTGSAIEGGTNFCTNVFKSKLDSLGIDAHWDLGNSGTHSWGYWQDDLHQSWDQLFSDVLY